MAKKRSKRKSRSNNMPVTTTNEQSIPVRIVKQFFVLLVARVLVDLSYGLGDIWIGVQL